MLNRYLDISFTDKNQNYRKLALRTKTCKNIIPTRFLKYSHILHFTLLELYNQIIPLVTPIISNTFP